MKMNKVATILVAVVFAGLGLGFSTLNAAKPQLSDALYASSLATVPAQADGKTVSLGAFRNQVLVVNFWATWCAPCVKEMPELSTLQTELKASHVQFIGIGIDNPTDLTEFAQKYKITYPLFVGGMSGTQLATDLGNKVGGLPYTVLLDKSGAVVKTYSGKLDMVQLKKDILQLH